MRKMLSDLLARLTRPPVYVVTAHDVGADRTREVRVFRSLKAASTERYRLARLYGDRGVVTLAARAVL